jgi:hypothetical protein
LREGPPHRLKSRRSTPVFFRLNGAGFDESTLSFWKIVAYRAFNWWDMEKFSAQQFFEVATKLQWLIDFKYSESGDDNLDPGTTKVLIDWLKDLNDSCKAIGLRLSRKYCETTIADVNSKKLFSALTKNIPELQHRIQDEMTENLFMFIPPDRAAYYNKPELLGKNTNARFSTIQYDVTEAGNCYASGRSTAVVFHLMRIMEVGVQEFGNKLGVVLVNEKNWQNILDEINKAIRALDQKAPPTKEFAGGWDKL